MSTIESHKNGVNFRLRELRKIYIRTSLRELAEKLGVSLSYVHSMEKGKRPVSNAIVQKLETIFGVDPSWLIHGEGHPLKQGGEEPSVRRVERPPGDSPGILALTAIDAGEIPTREHYIAYLDSFLESAEGDDDKLSWGYRRMRYHLPRFSDDWNTDGGRYREILRAASDLAVATFPDDEKEQANFFDQTILIAMAKSSLGSKSPEMRELARSYLSDLLETGEESKEAQEQTANN